MHPTSHKGKTKSMQASQDPTKIWDQCIDDWYKSSQLLLEVDLALFWWRHSILPWVQQLSHIPAKEQLLEIICCRTRTQGLTVDVILLNSCVQAQGAGRPPTGSKQPLTNDNTQVTPPSALPHPSFSKSMPSKPVQVSWNPTKHTPTLQWQQSSSLSLTLSLSLHIVYCFLHRVSACHLADVVGLWGW